MGGNGFLESTTIPTRGAVMGLLRYCAGTGALPVMGYESGINNIAA